MNPDTTAVVDSILWAIQPRLRFIVRVEPQPGPSWWHLHAGHVALAAFALFLLAILLWEPPAAREDAIPRAPRRIRMTEDTGPK